MAMIEATTELEAVNRMLLSIGQAPVSTLTVTGIRDVNVARDILKSVQRTFLTAGWSFNTDEEYPIQPDVDGHCVVPSGALSADASDAFENLTVRRNGTKGLCFYNLDDRTFVFTETVNAKIVWGTEFNDLPEAARHYIATRAGRRFQVTSVGSQVLESFDAEDEARAWLNVQRDERRTRDSNMFRRSRSLAGFGNRRY